MNALAHADSRAVYRRRPPPSIDLKDLEDELTRNRLNEIAILIRALTYGEMMELAESIWKLRPPGDEISQDHLPMMFHKWSTKQ